MEEDAILKINLKNQQKLWSRCPFCGRKPRNVEWATRRLTVCCENDITKLFATVGYGPEENDFTDLMNELRENWREMASEVREKKVKRWSF